MNSAKIKKRQRIIISSAVLIACTALILVTKANQPQDQNFIKLNAKVEYDGTKITVTNNDDFDYPATELYINKHYKLIGFNLMAG